MPNRKHAIHHVRHSAIVLPRRAYLNISAMVQCFVRWAGVVNVDQDASLVSKFLLSMSVSTVCRSLPGRSLLHGSFCCPSAQQHLQSVHLQVRTRPGHALTPRAIHLREKHCRTSYPTRWRQWQSLPVAPVCCTQELKFSPSENGLRTRGNLPICVLFETRNLALTCRSNPDVCPCHCPFDMQARNI